MFDQNITFSCDIEPDVNMLNDSSRCLYYTYSQFNEMLTKNLTFTKSFSVLHPNIHSLTQNLSHLNGQLNTVDIKFSVIGIIETWLRHPSHLVDIDGFKFVHRHCETRLGGGVGFYVSTDLSFKLRPNLKFNDLNITESLFIEVLKPKSNIIVGVIYRPTVQNLNIF